MEVDIGDIKIVGILNGVIVDPVNPASEAGVMFEIYRRGNYRNMVYYQDQICSVADFDGEKQVGNEIGFDPDTLEAITLTIKSQFSKVTADGVSVGPEDRIYCVNINGTIGDTLAQYVSDPSKEWFSTRELADQYRLTKTLPEHIEQIKHD